MKKKTLVFLLLWAAYAQAQSNKTPENWYLLDPEVNKVYGGGVNEAYDLLKGKKAKKITVAVIDSGVDSEHEDLKSVMWTNEDEIPNNGVDDDNNGYVDDIHGWSFIGGPGGDIDQEALEISRIYHKLVDRYGKVSSTADLPENEQKEYEYFLEIEKEYTSSLTENFNQFQNMAILKMFIETVKNASDGKYTKASITAFEPKNEIDQQIKQIALKDKFYGPGFEEDILEGEKHYSEMVQGALMNADSIRAVVVGDDPDNLENMYYGCNRIKGPDASHGTHVAGIIGADRNNNLGIIGIADHVEIMAIRAVPNGDERDKDVAFGIRYAVDNGASVINMSFGKGYSPNKHLVDEAIVYAESKDVLIVHAAGNENENIDVVPNFPDRNFDNGKQASNVIVVGASSYKKGKNILANFSNYGKQDVDIFGPGVDIYSTYPDNGYDTASGTSMACPAVAGMASIIRSYYPELKASEVRKLLMETAQPYKCKLIKPGTSEKTRLNELCISGGFVNVKNAVQKLESMTN